MFQCWDSGIYQNRDPKNPKKREKTRALERAIEGFKGARTLPEARLPSSVTREEARVARKAVIVAREAVIVARQVTIVARSAAMEVRYAQKMDKRTCWTPWVPGQPNQTFNKSNCRQQLLCQIRPTGHHCYTLTL